MARFVPGRSMPNIAKLRQTSMPSGGADAGGYTEPPTDRDLAQSVVHHTNSAEHDLRHAGPHIAEAARAVREGDSRSALYNLGHAGGHVSDGLGHTQAAQDRMSDNPRFQPHVDALGGRISPRDGGGGDVMGDDGAGASMEGPPAPDRTFRKAFGRLGGTPRFKGRR